MPRRNKTSADFDAEIQKCVSKIARYEELLKNEQAKLEELQVKKRDAELQGLYDFMQSNNLTPFDVIDKLKTAPTESERTAAKEAAAMFETRTFYV